VRVLKQLKLYNADKNTLTLLGDFLVLVEGNKAGSKSFCGGFGSVVYLKFFIDIANMCLNGVYRDKQNLCNMFV